MFIQALRARDSETKHHRRLAPVDLVYWSIVLTGLALPGATNLLAIALTACLSWPYTTLVYLHTMLWPDYWFVVVLTTFYLALPFVALASYAKPFLNEASDLGTYDSGKLMIVFGGLAGGAIVEVGTILYLFWGDSSESGMIDPIAAIAIAALIPLFAQIGISVGWHFTESCVRTEPPGCTPGHSS